MDKSPAEMAAERRCEIARAIKAETGIDEAMISALVRQFYDRVRSDWLLGPIFADRVADWDAHIEKLCAFWSSVALSTGRYHGQPMRAHLDLSITEAHFDRWLELFEQTAVAICPATAAAHFIDRARRIADSFEMAIAMKRGRIANPRHAVRKTGP
jgi:hemoglobin